MSEELEKRVTQFNSLSLPGQSPVMHIGTSYLVNDLWREVRRLRAIEAAARLVLTDGHEYPGPENGWIDSNHHDETLAKLSAALEKGRHE